MSSNEPITVTCLTEFAKDSIMLIVSPSAKIIFKKVLRDA